MPRSAQTARIFSHLLTWPARPLPPFSFQAAYRWPERSNARASGYVSSVIVTVGIELPAGNSRISDCANSPTATSPLRSTATLIGPLMLLESVTLGDVEPLGYSVIVLLPAFAT